MLDRYHAAMATLVRESPLLAMALIEHRNMRGMPMSFGTMPYLPPLYHRLPLIDGADIISGVQTGKSELFILLMLYLAGWRGRTCAYVLPTFALRGRFVKRRIDPVLESVPAYRNRLPRADREEINFQSKGSQALKFFGSGTMMFLGSSTATDFIEFSADALFIDEYDACDPANLAKARDRILASPYPQLFNLGNPSLPGTGIDKLYQNSDQRRWYYKCPHCGEYQPLDWFVNFVRRRNDGSWEPLDRERYGAAIIAMGGGMRIVEGDLRPVCRRCEKPFERAEAWYAWVAENPAPGRREGYRMSRLDILSQSMRALFAEWVAAQGNTADLARFYTSNLGIAYEHGGGVITVEHLTVCSTGEENDEAGDPKYANELVVMGVDVGSVLNVTIDIIRVNPSKVIAADGTISEPTEQPGIVRKCVHIGGYSSFEDLQDVIERFEVQVCVVDAMPETRKAQELRDWGLSTGKCDVWLCEFHKTPRVGSQRFGMQLDWRPRVVKTDRTQLLDASFDDIRFRRRVFPSDALAVPGWSDQMRASKRVLDEAKARIVWTEGNAADHYRLSDAYALVAYELSQSGGTYSTSDGTSETPKEAGPAETRSEGWGRRRRRGR